MRIRVLAVTLTATAALLAGCGYDATPLPKAENSTPAAPGAAATPVECTNPTQSYDPSGDKAAAVKQLTNKGRLVVGVSGDTYKMGFTDPTDGKLKGFDIAFAEEIGKALGVPVEYRVIQASDRITMLDDGRIDMVARNMTVNCDRWTQVAFSAVYYNATQKVLVGSDEADTYTGPADLAGKRVCAPASTTSVANIKKIEPDVVAVEAGTHTGCLIKFQNSEVDAITGDDTVLAGLAAQDPYTAVPQQEKLTDEPYGLAFNKGDVALVRFVNSVLDQMRANGRWTEIYDQWLKPTLTVDATPPTPVYGR
ncbi:glutamate ABC transporter substrate-binding protein [Nocardioides nitrophenolicus]|uniref:glutamate ABC transporter substrate-binding protein n=1 Tax=Nocardioides nitrophenolicus TaxID=60489 RepID=UPI00195AF054|nr:glutamate ABC transporter substrate-binding protein [Nocardioides nitrophenolicus]MBM7519463.1 polar amino acid transport system substrate-binding protein [Nocardioides nitrophenolicus]